MADLLLLLVLLLVLLVVLVVVVVMHLRILLLLVVHVRGCPRHRPCFLGTHPLESERLVPPYPAPILLVVAVPKDQSRNNMQTLVLVVATVAGLCPSRRAMEMLHRAGAAIGSAIMLLQGFRLGYQWALPLPIIQWE